MTTVTVVETSHTVEVQNAESIEVPIQTIEIVTVGTQGAEGGAGTRSIQATIVNYESNVSTGDGKFYFHVDSRLSGMSLTDVHAQVITAGVTGTTDIQIHNVTDAVDMLSTKLTIDSGETGSDTATAAVINSSNRMVSQNDLIRIDIDAISTTAPKGLIVTLGFQLL